MTALVTGRSEGNSLLSLRVNGLIFQEKTPQAGGQDGCCLVEALVGGYGGWGLGSDHGRPFFFGGSCSLYTRQVGKPSESQRSGLSYRVRIFLLHAAFPLNKIDQ